MKPLLASIDLVLEVRDYRVPLTSRNPLLDDAIRANGNDTRRIVVFTKRDLAMDAFAGANGARERALRMDRVLRRCVARERASVESASKDGEGESEGDADVFFLHPKRPVAPAHQQTWHAQHSPQALLRIIAQHAATRARLTGTNVLVVGIPNTGKSTVLNALHDAGMAQSLFRPGAHKKVAATGGEAGVTRRLGTPVKLLEGFEVDRVVASRRGKLPSEMQSGYSEVANGVRNTRTDTDADNRRGRNEAVYMRDTPGVFVPYVPDAESMVKLALCSAVKEGLVAYSTLAEYLLWRMDREGRHEYLRYAGLQGPTNSVEELLGSVARRTGKLAKGGGVEYERTADWFVRQWRQGLMGRFVLDEIDEETLEVRRGVDEGGLEKREDGAGDAKVLSRANGEQVTPVSVSQARKALRERRKAKREARRSLGKSSSV